MQTPAALPKDTACQAAAWHQLKALDPQNVKFSHSYASVNLGLGMIPDFSCLGITVLAEKLPLSSLYTFVHTLKNINSVLLLFIKMYQNMQYLLEYIQHQKRSCIVSLGTTHTGTSNHP